MQFRVERSSSIEGVRRGEDSDGPRLADEQHQLRLTADETTDGMEETPAG